MLLVDMFKATARADLALICDLRYGQGDCLRKTVFFSKQCPQTILSIRGACPMVFPRSAARRFPTIGFSRVGGF
jgi:hypothetical protein